MRLRSPWLFGGVSAVILAIALLFYWLAWGDLTTYVRALDHCGDLFCDFTRQYYPTGQALFETGQPTNGYFYTTAFALLMAALAQFDLETAVLIWGAFQLGALLLLFRAGSDLLDRAPHWQWLYWSLLLLSVPVLHNLKWGQVSIFVTGCILGALALYRRGRGEMAMGLLVLGTAVKYYAALFLVYFLFKREWRLLLLFTILSLLIIVALPILLLGFSTNLEFYLFVNERIAHARSSWMLTDINSQYLANVVTRLFDPQPVNRLLVQGIGYTLTATNLLIAWWWLRRRGEREGSMLGGVLLLSFPLFLETSWPHYFVYLPFLQVFALQVLLSQNPPFAIMIAGGSMIGLSIFLASTPFFLFWESWQPYEKAGMLFWSNTVLLFLWYILIVRTAGEDITELNDG